MRPIVTDGVAWPVGLSVRLSVCQTSETCKNGKTDRYDVSVVQSVGPKEPCIIDGIHIPHDKGQFLGQRGWPIVKCRDSLL